MKIGIYKPVKKICFNFDPDDHAGWSSEIIPIIKILAKAGHKVHIISPTDYEEGSIENVSKEMLTRYHKIFMFNGPTERKDVLWSLQSLANFELYLIVTDLALIETDVSMFKGFISQSKRMGTYGHIEEGILQDYVWHNRTKNIPYYFGGTERDRLYDLLEYVYRPNCTWFGKSDFLGLRNYVSYDAHTNYMKRAKYTIIIGDKNYNAMGFVTPRYYEALKYDVIAFVDVKYDPDELLIKKTDFRRVSSYAEMYSKMKELDNDQKRYEDLLNYQREEITRVKVEGQNILKALLR